MNVRKPVLEKTLAALRAGCSAIEEQLEDCSECDKPRLQHDLKITWDSIGNLMELVEHERWVELDDETEDGKENRNER